MVYSKLFQRCKGLKGYGSTEHPLDTPLIIHNVVVVACECMSLTLIPELPLIFVTDLVDEETVEEETTEFVCETSQTDVEITWLKDNEVITPGIRYKMSRDGAKCTLTILNTKTDDSATFACMIVPSKATTYASLLVKGILTMTQLSSVM